MKIQIKEAFQTVQAQEDLKRKTKSSVLNIINKPKKKSVKRIFTFPRLVTVCLILILSFTGIQWLYFTQTALISIDINPSLELGVNRFDRIISTKGLNNDGSEILKNLNLYNKTSSEAVNEVLKNKQILKLESENEILTITVSCKNENQSQILLNQMEHCTQGHSNVHCQSLSNEESKEAQVLGLPNGKYRQYLILKKYDPNITPEKVTQMTMKEIRERINKYENSDSHVTTLENCNSENNQNYGYQHHHGQNHK